jgi:hypothetical protein
MAGASTTSADDTLVRYIYDRLDAMEDLPEAAREVIKQHKNPPRGLFGHRVWMPLPQFCGACWLGLNVLA